MKMASLYHNLTFSFLASSILATVSQSVLRQTTLVTGTSALASLGCRLSLRAAPALRAWLRSSHTFLQPRHRSKSHTKQLYLEHGGVSRLK